MKILRKNSGNYFIKHRKESQYFDSSYVVTQSHSHSQTAGRFNLQLATCLLPLCSQQVATRQSSTLGISKKLEGSRLNDVMIIIMVLSCDV